MRTPLVLIAIGALLVLAPSADAHTSLESSDVGEDDVTLHFDTPVDATQLHTWLEIGTEVVPLGAAVPVSDDAGALRIALPADTAGDIVLGWHAIAADGDASSGTVPLSFAAHDDPIPAGPIVALGVSAIAVPLLARLGVRRIVGRTKVGLAR